MTWRSIARLQCRLLLYTQANWHWLEGAVMFTTPLLLLFLRAFYHEPRRSVCVSFCPSLSLCVHDWQCDVMWYNYVILIKHWATSSWLLFLCVCMCMYVCMCVCVYVCVCVCKYTLVDRHAFGRSALMLSGGAYLGFYHVGEFATVLRWDMWWVDMYGWQGYSFIWNHGAVLHYSFLTDHHVSCVWFSDLSLVYGSLTCLLCMVLRPRGGVAWTGSSPSSDEWVIGRIADGRKHLVGVAERMRIFDWLRFD